LDYSDLGIPHPNSLGRCKNAGKFSTLIIPLLGGKVKIKKRRARLAVRLAVRLLLTILCVNGG
jgi:hypothetical protein